MRVKNFELDESRICDVTIRKEWSIYQNIPRTELTNEQLIKMIKGEDRCVSTHSEDHPEFASLRNTLEEQGYIRCERGWWNGDRVLKTFKLNGVLFRRDNKFPSGAAMKHHLEFKRSHPDYSY